MMKKLLLSLFLLLGLVGCSALTGSADDLPPIPTLQPTFTPAPTHTPLPTATAPVPTPLPTWTPLPPPELQATQVLPTATLLPEASPVAPAVGFGPEYFPEDVNPLTGLTLADPGKLERRPVAVKITNFPRSVRPQSGLTSADIVYEYYIERGLTRFVALFYGADVTKAGPIRSGRFFDEHIIRMYNSVLVFANADERVMDMWIQTDFLSYLVTEQTSNCPPVCRDESKEDYNNLFADTRLVSLYVSGLGVDNGRVPQTGYRFETRVPWGATPAAEINLFYSNLDYHQWVYDAQAGRYLRYQEKNDANAPAPAYAPLMDAYNKTQVGAENVVVIFVPHEYFERSSDTEIVKINLFRSGKAYVFRDGNAFEAEWERTNHDTPLEIHRPGGGAFPLKPGKTFIQVIGVTSLEEVTGETWSFEFAIP